MLCDKSTLRPGHQVYTCYGTDAQPDVLGTALLKRFRHTHAREFSKQCPNFYDQLNQRHKIYKGTVRRVWDNVNGLPYGLVEVESPCYSGVYIPQELSTEIPKWNRYLHASSIMFQTVTGALLQRQNQWLHALLNATSDSLDKLTRKDNVKTVLAADWKSVRARCLKEESLEVGDVASCGAFLGVPLCCVRVGSDYKFVPFLASELMIMDIACEGEDELLDIGDKYADAQSTV